jgi:hypothetical protein
MCEERILQVKKRKQLSSIVKSYKDDQVIYKKEVLGNQSTLLGFVENHFL